MVEGGVQYRMERLCSQDVYTLNFCVGAVLIEYLR